MPPRKKTTSKGALKNSSSQQRTLFDHFQRKSKPQAESDANTLQEPCSAPSSPPQMVESESVDASAQNATVPSPSASSPGPCYPPSSGPPSSPLPIDIATDDEKDTPVAPVPSTTLREAPKPLIPSTPVVGTTRDAPIVIASPPGTSKRAHPFFARRVAPPSPSKSTRNKAEGAPPVYPDRDSQHVRGPQVVPTRSREPAYPPRQSPSRDEGEQSTDLAFLKIGLVRDAAPDASATAPTGDDATQREAYLATIPDEHRAHPAISRILHDGPNDAENASATWAQQCMPQTARDVLGNERNALYLRDWLKKLQLDVSTPSTSGDAISNAQKPKPKPKTTKRPMAAPKRRGRKRMRIDSDDDNWIVETGDDYEEEEEAETVGGDEDEYIPTRLQRKHDDPPAPPAMPADPPSVSVPGAPMAPVPANGPPALWAPQPGTYYLNWAQYAPQYTQYAPYAQAQAYQPAPWGTYPPGIVPYQFMPPYWPPPPVNYPPVPPPQPAPVSTPPPPVPTLARPPQPVNNGILLAGPTGSGKTAAVYACAAELGFEVFEVYPGIGRRNGASIDHLIGNVGRNHLVRQARSDTKAKNAFATLMKPKGVDDQIPEEEAATPPPPSKENGATFRQSLILLEEVDILYKEDTNFWPSLVTFMKTSRRPVVLTCNDLSIVPYDIPLQQILHFERCPVPLATSLLQSLCCKHERPVPRAEVARFCDDWSDAEDTRVGSGCDLRHAVNALQLHCTTRRPPPDEEEEAEDALDALDLGADVAAARRRQTIHTELLSFMDAHACAHSLGQTDPWARSAPGDDDELGHPVLFNLPTHPDVGVAFRGRVDELAASAARLSARSARGGGVCLPPSSSPPPPPPLRPRARALFRDRVEMAERVARLRGARALARAGGGEALYLDYLPYVRQMAATDDALEAAALSGGTIARGGRTTRNSARAMYARTVILTEDQREALAGTALAG
ncbi:hypothetical protein HDZ31DRAFT_31881 [Schizophyllum fasciatum]